MFLLLELLAGIMFFQFNHYQQSVWLTQANAVTGRVLEWEADVLAYMGLKARNAELTERNIALQIEAACGGKPWQAVPTACTSIRCGRKPCMALS